MVDHVTPIGQIYQGGSNVSMAEIRTFETEQDTAIDAVRNETFAYWRNRVDVSSLQEATGDSDPDLTVKAAANTSLLNAALADSAATGKLVSIPNGHWPITKLVPPDSGGFRLEMAPGAWLRPVAAEPTGFVRSNTETTGWAETTIHGLHIWPFTDSSTSLPYAGSGLVAKFTEGSHVEDVRINYAGDQALILQVYDTRVDNVYVWTDHAAAGTGGVRVNGGQDSVINGVRGQSGDDFVMLNVGHGGPFANTSITRVGYRDVFGHSLVARLAIVFVDDLSQAGGVLDCYIDGLRGTADNECLYVASHISDRAVRGLRVLNAALSDSLNTNYPLETPQCVMIKGNVAQSSISAHIRSPQRGWVQITDSNGIAPADVQLRVVGHQDAAFPERAAIELSAGSRVTITDSHIVAPTGFQAINITAGDRHRIVNTRISNVNSGTTGVRVAGATRVDLIGCQITGSGGTAYNFDSGAADGTVQKSRVLGCDLVGLSTAGTAPYVADTRT